MRCFRIELVRHLEGGDTSRHVFFEEDQVAAHAVYQAMAEDDSVGDERTRGVFIDVLEVNTDGDLVQALKQAQSSRYDLNNLAPVGRTAGAF